MKHLELKLPPPLAALLAGLAMWAVSGQVAGFGWPQELRFTLAAVFLVAGASFDFAALFLFLKNRTSVNPLQPQRAQTLVQNGVYRLTRNPMYLGLSLLLLAWASYLANPAAFFTVALFAAYITRFQIIPEERILQTKFGPVFQTYQNQTRRWL